MDFVLDTSMFEGCFDVLVEAGSPVITTFICLSVLMAGFIAIFDMIQNHFDVYIPLKTAPYLSKRLPPSEPFEYREAHNTWDRRMTTRWEPF